MVGLGEQPDACGDRAELVEQRPFEYAWIDDVEQRRDARGQDQRLAHGLGSDWSGLSVRRRGSGANCTPQLARGVSSAGNLVRQKPRSQLMRTRRVAVWLCSLI